MCVQSKSGTHKTLDGLGQHTGQNEWGLTILGQNQDRKEIGYRTCDSWEAEIMWVFFFFFFFGVLDLVCVF